MALGVEVGVEVESVTGAAEAEPEPEVCTQGTVLIYTGVH